MCGPHAIVWRLPWSQRLSFIRSFWFGSLRREALIEAPSPREKKTSGQERWESHFHAGSALDSCQRCHFLLTNHKRGSDLQFVHRSNHITRGAIKNILQSETTVKSWWHESEVPNGLDQRLSFLGSQRFVPVKKKNKRRGSRHKICQ